MEKGVVGLWVEPLVLEAVPHSGALTSLCCQGRAMLKRSLIQPSEGRGNNSGTVVDREY
ncbi:MAG: hypothetical protein RJB66_922 [Pseudomonadota bacterium]